MHGSQDFLRAKADETGSIETHDPSFPYEDHHLGHREVATLLLTNGSLPVERLNDYSDLVIRAFEEIRKLFRDKGTLELKRMAGISK